MTDKPRYFTLIWVAPVFTNPNVNDQQEAFDDWLNRVAQEERARPVAFEMTPVGNTVIFRRDAAVTTSFDINYSGDDH